MKKTTCKLVSLLIIPALLLCLGNFAPDALAAQSESITITVSVQNPPPVERLYIYLNGKRVAMKELEYYPYGETKVEQGSLATSRKFTGKELDDSTGLYDYGARHYDPQTCRFISADPLEWDEETLKAETGKGLQEFLANPQNLNRYSYCGNNPLIYIDPYGLDYWIEGPSSGEPRGHQSFCVGDPNGSYESYSFGINNNINFKYGLEGEVYKDPLAGGEIVPNSYRRTTAIEDQVIEAELDARLGTKGAYLPWSTCRNYSQKWHMDLDKRDIGNPVMPPARNAQQDLPSSRVPTSSSTVLLSEPYGSLSSSTVNTTRVSSISSRRLSSGSSIDKNVEKRMYP